MGIVVCLKRFRCLLKPCVASVSHGFHRKGSCWWREQLASLAEGYELPRLQFPMLIVAVLSAFVCRMMPLPPLPPVPIDNSGQTAPGAPGSVIAAGGYVPPQAGQESAGARQFEVDIQRQQRSRGLH